MGETESAAEHYATANSENKEYTSRIETTIGNDLKEIEKYCDEVLEPFLVKYGWNEKDAWRTAFNVKELLQNGMIYGNLGLESEDQITEEIMQGARAQQTKLHVTIEMSPDKLHFTVQDEGDRTIMGEKIKRESEPKLDFDDPTTSENILKPGGRGGFLLKQFADPDSVRFGNTPDLGMWVEFTKTKPTQ